MLEVIPVLPVNDVCHWCAPQECFTASLWYGDCLLVFYTKDATRLAPDTLNDLACDILKEITKSIEPESSDVIDPQKLWKAIGQAGVLPCYWEDFRPPAMLVYRSSVCIPVEAGGGKS